MDREEIEKLVEEAAGKSRKKRKGPDAEKIRKVLNIFFLAGAAIGLILYFTSSDNHLLGMSVIGTAMILKIIEFFLRFMF